jgi:hypothetical protein
MPQRKSKKSGRSSYDRLIAYDSEICIEICAELLLGKKLQEICSKPPMPVGQVFLGWVQDHREAREIYRSAQNFQSDRRLAKELNVSLAVSVREWKDQVGANVQRGWRADWVERKYIPPDWSKVFPLVGGPPVDTENMQAYSELLDAYTEMLEPRDVLELGWVKEMADAASEAQSVTAFDYGALRARSKNYQRVDRTRMRAIKRRDNALRQIALWRKGPGAKPHRLPDHLVVEDLLARRYGVETAAADTDAISGGTPEPPRPVAPASEAAKPARSFAPQAEAADARPPFAVAAEATEAAPHRAAPDNDAIATAPVHPTVETTGATQTTETPPAVHRTDETAEAGPPFAVAAVAKEAAPHRAARHDGRSPAASVRPLEQATGATPASHPRSPKLRRRSTARTRLRQLIPQALLSRKLLKLWRPSRTQAKPPKLRPRRAPRAMVPWQPHPRSTQWGTLRHLVPCVLAVRKPLKPCRPPPRRAKPRRPRRHSPPPKAAKSCAPAPSLAAGAEALAFLAPVADAAQASPPVRKSGCAATPRS